MDLLRILDGTPEPPILNPFVSNPNTSGDYHLLAEMLDFQKELTDQIVSLHYSDILKFMALEEVGAETSYLEDSMKTMHSNLSLVATHPYLLITHFMPKSLITRDMPGRLRETSGKFRVLGDLILCLVEVGVFRNVGVVARSGDRSHDMVEALLLGHNCNLRRHEGVSLKKEKPKRVYDLTVHILPDRHHPDLDLGAKVDFLISLDFLADTHSYSTILNPRAFVLRIIPANTVDHISLSFQHLAADPVTQQTNPTSINPGVEGGLNGPQAELTPPAFGQPLSSTLPDTPRKTLSGDMATIKNITNAAVILRDRVGHIPPDLRPIYNTNLRFLGPWFRDTANAPSTPSWPLPELHVISRYLAWDVEKSLLTEVKFDFHYEEDEAEKPMPEVPVVVRNQGAYYETKRLHQKYIDNPLRLDPQELSGISVGSSKSKENRFVSPNVLTHRLIYEVNRAYWLHERTARELRFFQEHEQRRNGTMADNAAVEAAIKAETKTNRERNALAKVSLQPVRVEPPEGADLPLVVLAQAVKDAQTREANLQQEAAYVAKEVERAQTVVSEAAKEMARLEAEQQTLSLRLEQLFDQDQLHADAKGVDALHQQIVELTSANVTMQAKMSQGLAILVPRR